MIVDARTLAVRPIADRLLAAAGSEDGSDVERGAAAWSNELALHVVEIKTNGPVARLGGVGELMQSQIREIDRAARAARRATDAERDAPVHGSTRRAAAVAARERRHLPRLRSHLRLPRPRLGQSPERPRQPAVRGRRRVRAAPRRDPGGAADPARAGRELPGGGRTPDRARRHPHVGLRRQRRAGAVGRRCGRARAGLHPARVRGGPARRDLPRPRAARSRGRAAPRVGERARLRSRDSTAARSRSASSTCRSARPPTSPSRGRRSRRCARWSRSVTPVRRSSAAGRSPALAAVLRDAIAAGDEAIVGDDAYLRLFGFPGRAPCRARDLWQHLIETEARRDPAFAEWEPALALYVAEGCLARRITERARRGAVARRHRSRLPSALRLPHGRQALHWRVGEQTGSALTTHHQPARARIARTMSSTQRSVTGELAELARSYTVLGAAARRGHRRQALSPRLAGHHARGLARAARRHPAPAARARP